MNPQSLIARFEIDDYLAEGEINASRGQVTEQVLEASLDDFTDRIKLYGEQLIGAVRRISDTPSEVSIEFGLKLEAQAGVVVAKVATHAHFIVKLTWKKSDGEDTN